MRAISVLVLCLAVVSAVPRNAGSRIFGGSVTPISNYPSIVSLLYALDTTNFVHNCGGTILNERSILTAVHCFYDFKNNMANWRARVGSASASSGGNLYEIRNLIGHPNYSSFTFDSDIGILRTVQNIVFVNNAVQPATLGSYFVTDNQLVYAAGWGLTEAGSQSNELRHVQLLTINQQTCQQRYGTPFITSNMLCAGWLDVGGRDQCRGDDGGPLYHSGVAVAVTSWGTGCALPFYPGVNTRVSNYVNWIRDNA